MTKVRKIKYHKVNGVRIMEQPEYGTMYLWIHSVKEVIEEDWYEDKIINEHGKTIEKYRAKTIEITTKDKKHYKFTLFEDNEKNDLE